MNTIVVYLEKDVAFKSCVQVVWTRMTGLSELLQQAICVIKAFGGLRSYHVRAHKEYWLAKRKVKMCFNNDSAR
jgi:hypothetical protein